jgi:hypothetical protein
MFRVERRRDFKRREEFEAALRADREALSGVMLYESVAGQSAETRRLTADLDDMIGFYTQMLYDRMEAR